MPACDLRVSLVQADTVWRDAAANRALYGELIAPLRGQTDLVVLPETFTSGFGNDAIDQAEGMQGASVAWLRAQAERIGAAITGSLLIAEDGKVYNRLVWAGPGGELACYDKRHLFRMADEHLRYAAGRERIVISWRGWRVLPQVCYDLRFPVWSRNRLRPTPLAEAETEAGIGAAIGREAAAAETGECDYDLALYVANWPSPRRYAWRTLLRARAIENLACVIGVNRVGSDGNGLSYSGDSAALDALGQPLLELGAQAQVATTCLSAAALRQQRERFPALCDADRFCLQP